MNYRPLVTFLLFTFVLNSPALAAKKFVDCGKGQSLNEGLKNLDPGDSLGFTGVCKESVRIPASGITLIGTGNAVISPESPSGAAVTINGVQRVGLQNLTVESGRFGIHALGGAGIVLQNVVAQNNAQTGILVEGSSSAYVSNTTSQNNALHGIDVESSSAFTINGDVLAHGNGVFGVHIGTSSSGILNAGTFTAQRNALGIQISISSSFFMAGPSAVVRAVDNFTVGLTIVSGAHFFAFGGTIVTSGNGLDGVDLASRAGMDLDAGAELTSFNNGRDGLHAEELSMVNLFNNPQFSGAGGFTSVHVYNNAVNGISMLNNSQLHMFFQAQIQSNDNAGKGVLIDDGSSMLMINSTIRNNSPDVVLTFGSRGDISRSTIGTLRCDATALIRGDTGKTCPQ